jgi:hypothetical protein
VGLKRHTNANRRGSAPSSLALPVPASFLVAVRVFYSASDPVCGIDLRSARLVRI